MFMSRISRITGYHSSICRVTCRETFRLKVGNEILYLSNYQEFASVFGLTLLHLQSHYIRAETNALARLVQTPIPENTAEDWVPRFWDGLET